MIWKALPIWVALFCCVSSSFINIIAVKNNKWRFRLLLLFMLWAFAELCGYAAMYVASHPTPYMSYGDYFKIRKNLLGEAEADELPRYTPAPSLNYIPTPNYVHADVEQHNADGYRGERLPLSKGASTLRVLCLGGSTTYGSAVKHPDQSYPAQLQLLLTEQLPLGTYDQVEVINAGAEAATSAEELAYYHFKFRYYNPDIVVLHTGGNDALTDPNDFRYQPDYTHFRNVNMHIPELPAPAKLIFRSYLLSFISINFYYRPLVERNYVLSAAPDDNDIDWYDAEQVDTGINADGFYNNVDLLLNEIKHDGHQVLIMPFIINKEHEFSAKNPNYVKRVDEINITLTELTAKYNAIWVPFKKSTINSPDSWKDDCHLDVNGEHDKAVLVKETLLELLRSTAYLTDSTSM